MDLQEIKDKIITIRNNFDKFPDRYIIVLTDSEKAEVVENFDHPRQIGYLSYNQNNK